MSDLVAYCLHKTYDRTTPSGEGGGDSVKARLNAEVFNAAYAIVHSGMKDLADKSPAQHSLLMYYHTHEWDFRHIGLILDALTTRFWEIETPKGLHADTLEKIPRLIKFAIVYAKAYTGQYEITNADICRYVEIPPENWSKKDRRSQWELWFNSLQGCLREMERDADEHLEPYCQMVTKEKRRISNLSTGISKVQGK